MDREEVDRRSTKLRASFRARIDCWRDTSALAARNPPPPPSVKSRHVDAETTTVVRLHDQDSIDCGLAYAAAGHDPVVLNLADDVMAGGCVDVGSGAQEESIFRRTNLCATLLQTMYPILDDEAIYSPGVSVYKRSEAEGWRIMDPPPTLSFITCPGVKYPHLDYGDGSGPARLTLPDANRLAVKIRTVLQTALKHGHDTVVLGASSCGAWKAPPEHVAEIFVTVVREFVGVFRTIAFAILKNADDNAAAKVAMGIRDNHDVFLGVLTRARLLPAACCLLPATRAVIQSDQQPSSHSGGVNRGRIDRGTTDVSFHDAPGPSR